MSDIGLELRLDQLLELTKPRARKPRKRRSREAWSWERPGTKVTTARWTGEIGPSGKVIGKAYKGGKARLAAGERGPRGGRTEAQSLLFPRSAWTAARAKAWAKRNGHRYGDVDVTDRYVRLRQDDPGKYRRLRTINFGRGIKAVVGVR